MAQIVFPSSTMPGVAPGEDLGRLINTYLERATQGERPQWSASPGLTRVVNQASRTHTRALFAATTTGLFAVYDERIYIVTLSGTTWTATDLGALTGDDLITIARNMAGTPNYVAVTDDGCFNLFTGSAPTSFADGDLPATNSVTFLNGYFIWTTGNGEIWASDINAVTVNPLSFTRAQTRSDGLLRGVTFRENLFAFGQASCEVYRDVGGSPFPLGFVTTIARGLIAKFAVAGFEEGWSNELLWVGDDAVVYRMNGYSPERVSLPWISRRIEALSLTDRGLLAAFVTMTGGHAFWHLSSSEWTIVYDLATGQWHEREAYLGGPWRASCSAKFLGYWMTGDRDGGELYVIDENQPRDHDDPICCRWQSAPTEGFPQRAGVPRADFYFTAGVGLSYGDDPTQTAPRASISWSDDGGATFSNPLHRQIGPQGAYGLLCTVFRTGMAGPKGRVWRVDMSDPVHRRFQGGSMAIEGRSE